MVDRTQALEEELQHMRGELQVAQRLEAVGQLAAGVAHEINTPTQYVMDNTRFFGEAFADLADVLRSYEALRQAVLAGHGIAVLGNYAISDDLSQRRMLRLLPGWDVPPLSVQIVYPPTRNLGRRRRYFIDYITRRQKTSI